MKDNFKFLFQDENSDLFYALPWSYGTLGFLVSATIQIIPAKKYLKMEYIPVHSKKDMVKVFADETNKGEENMFVEGLVYSENSAVIMLGNMTDTADPEKVGGIKNFL